MDKLCTACGTKLRFVMEEKLQLGQTGWVLGDLPNLMAGAMKVAVWSCPNCGKLEFYWPEGNMPEESAGADRMAQVKCPFCGVLHDLDDVWCPLCNRRLDGAK